MDLFISILLLYAIESETHGHLFKSSFVVDLWAKVLEAFNWDIVLLNDYRSWINILVIDHP